jgi:two-component system OmpR family response regulator
VRILVIEDDEKIASFIVKGLKENGFAVDRAADGEEGYSLSRAVTYDAVVLDLMLPKLDGLSLLRRMRQDLNLLPVLILSAKATVEHRISGLQAGGDDYLSKPFAFSELLARIHALIRRATQIAEPTSLTVGDLCLNLLTREVTRAGRQIELQTREFALLELLMRHPGRPIPKTLILEHIWDYSFDPQTNVVDVLAHRLRTKLEKNFPTKIMHTIRGVGYVLKAS